MRDQWSLSYSWQIHICVDVVSAMQCSHFQTNARLVEELRITQVSHSARKEQGYHAFQQCFSSDHSYLLYKQN